VRDATDPGGRLGGGHKSHLVPRYVDIAPGDKNNADHEPNEREGLSTGVGVERLAAVAKARSQAIEHRRASADGEKQQRAAHSDDEQEDERGDVLPVARIQRLALVCPGR
jgi:hypothetical protein